MATKCSEVLSLNRHISTECGFCLCHQRLM